MANPFVHVELQTEDPDGAKRFYRSLFDWKLQDMPEMEYTIIDVGDGTGGGIMKGPVPGGQPQWVPYVLVDDVSASTEKARSLGGRVVTEITEIPGYGWFSVFIDPTGSACGLWQPKKAK